MDQPPSAPPPTWQGRQPVLNVSWPPNPRDSRRRDDPIPVIARVVWATDGETHLEALAVDWLGHHVRVELDDARLHTLCVWLDAGDVRRRRSSDRQVV